MKPERLKKILKNLRKDRRFNERNGKWEKINPKILAGIRRSLIQSRQRVNFYQSELERSVRDNFEFTKMDKLLYFSSEYEAYIKILAKVT